jgi:hypothetical protein
MSQSITGTGRSAADRDDQFAQAFATVAQSFSAGLGVIDVLHTLVDECGRALGIADVGVVLADRRGILHILAATSERAALVEALQVQTSTGPCWRAYRNGSAVSVPVIHDATDETLQFRQVAAEQHFRSVYATPLLGYNTTMGALNLFSSGSRSITAEDGLDADAFARTAAVALLMDGERALPTVDRIQQAIDAREKIEQAKSVVASVAGVSREEAFRRIRSRALMSSRSLADVADALRSRLLHF